MTPTEADNYPILYRGVKPTIEKDKYSCFDSSLNQTVQEIPYSFLVIEGIYEDRWTQTQPILGLYNAM